MADTKSFAPVSLVGTRPRRRIPNKGQRYSWVTLPFRHDPARGEMFIDRNLHKTQRRSEERKMS